MRPLSLLTFCAITMASLAVQADAEPSNPVQEYLTTRIGWLATQKAPGMQALGPIQMGPPQRDGASLSLQVELEAGRCYSLIATGAPAVDDADMYLFAPNDEQLLADKSEGRDMFLLSCPTTSGSHRIELKLKDGKGDLALRVFVNGKSPAATVDEPPPPPKKKGKRFAQRHSAAASSRGSAIDRVGKARAKK